MFISKGRHFNKYSYCTNYSILVPININVVVIFRLYSKAPKLWLGSIIQRHNELYYFFLLWKFYKDFEDFVQKLIVLMHPI